jgi:uncharacterized Zn finger protein
LCSRQVYERGLAYFREGRVSNTQIPGMMFRANVQGSEFRSHRIKIEYDNKCGRLIPNVHMTKSSVKFSTGWLLNIKD